jgi:hypothetical protein
MNTIFFFHMVFLGLLDFTSCLHSLVLKVVFLGAKMAHNFFWKCTFCSFNGTFGVLNSISQHVKGATHVLAQKNRETSGIVGNQMSIQDFFTKGVIVSKIEYPPLFKFVDILYNELLSYCAQHVYYGILFRNISLI